MPKAYIIASVNVNDPKPTPDMRRWRREAMKKYNARVLARGGRCEALEGEARSRNVMLEFDDYETAKAYFHSVGVSGRRGHIASAPPISI